MAPSKCPISESPNLRISEPRGLRARREAEVAELVGVLLRGDASAVSSRARAEMGLGQIPSSCPSPTQPLQVCIAIHPSLWMFLGEGLGDFKGMTQCLIICFQGRNSEC